MKDLRRALQRRSERGDPIGSDRLRQRVAFELAGGHMRPEDTRRLPIPIMVGSLVLLVVVAVGAVALLSGDDAPDTPIASITTAPVVTTNLPTVIEYLRIPTDADFAESYTNGAFVDERGITIVGCRFGGVTDNRSVPTPILHAEIWFSSDGREWESLLDPTAADDAGCIGDVMATSTGYLATGPSVVWLSNDGGSWTRVDPPEMSEVPTRISAVVDGPRGLLAAGWAAGELSIWSSDDGADWTRVSDATLDVRAEVYAVAATDLGYFVAGEVFESEFVSVPGLWFSPDRTTWTRIPPEAFDTDSPDELKAIDGVVEQPDGSVVAIVGFVGAWQSENGYDWEPYDGGPGFVPPERLADGRLLDRIGDGADELIGLSSDDGATWAWYSTTGLDDELHHQLGFTFGSELFVFADYEYPYDDEGLPPPPMEVWVAAIPG